MKISTIRQHLLDLTAATNLREKARDHLQADLEMVFTPTELRRLITAHPLEFVAQFAIGALALKVES